MNTLKLPFPLRFLQPFDFPRKLGLMDRIFGRWLSRKGIVWVRTAAGIPWKLDLAYTPCRWIVYGKYEGSPFLNWAQTHLKSHSLVVDSGANIGQMLMYIAQRVPDGKVFAFEPGRNQAEWLKECLQRNPQLAVEWLPYGLGDRKRAAHLKETGPAFVHGDWNQVSETEGEDITLIRLSDFLAERHIEQVDLWKLDVEGFEIPALKGASEHLINQTIRALYVELAGENGERIVDFLRQFPYQGFLFNRNGSLSPLGELPEHTNGLFLPQV
jgi:FkbM family methyltransferase